MVQPEKVLLVPKCPLCPSPLPQMLDFKCETFKEKDLQRGGTFCSLYSYRKDMVPYGKSAGLTRGALSLPRCGRWGCRAGSGWRLPETDGATAGSQPVENLQIRERKFYVLQKGRENLQSWEDLGEGGKSDGTLPDESPIICLVIDGGHLPSCPLPVQGACRERHVRASFLN